MHETLLAHSHMTIRFSKFKYANVWHECSNNRTSFTTIGNSSVKYQLYHYLVPFCRFFPLHSVLSFPPKSVLSFLNLYMFQVPIIPLSVSVTSNGTISCVTSTQLGISRSYVKWRTGNRWKHNPILVPWGSLIKMNTAMFTERQHRHKQMSEQNQSEHRTDNNNSL